ncbi:hypothetical protein GGR57DRAFT_507953 [Xylariaceae sp. FL1272]|nr:hypothetical protein GGR57DRAFT_507953 [Xylariaceae sp. FL1272]
MARHLPRTLLSRARHIPMRRPSVKNYSVFADKTQHSLDMYGSTHKESKSFTEIDHYLRAPCDPLEPPPYGIRTADPFGARLDGRCPPRINAVPPRHSRTLCLEMGRQESSPHHQRHRMPHRRRHHHHHQKHAKLAHPESNLSLGNLNREFQDPGGKVRVESWLGQVTGPAGSTSKMPRRQEIYSAEQPRLQHDDPPLAHQARGRVDPLWRPKHMPPANGVKPELFSPSTGQGFGLNRYKRNSSGNSSLISDSYSPSESRSQSRSHTPVEDKSRPRCRPRHEAEMDYAHVSSSTSHERCQPQTIDKRPRRKTKVDKYDTKKQSDRKRKKLTSEQNSIQDEKRTTEPGLRKKKRRKNPGASGKNAMNRFASEAVLNDRITVQHGLKPGLFENRRVPREEPVLDLSFSGMDIRKEGIQQTQQSTPLSKSRRRDRQREEREREHISSFFIPPNNLHKVMVSYAHEHDDDEANPDGHDGIALVHGKRQITSPFDSHSDNHYEEFQQPRGPPNRGTSPVISSAQSHDCRSNSSRTTSYYTWSSSRLNVPDDAQACVNRPLSPSERGGSATPETVRRAILNTGIYRDTRIRPYDDWTIEQTLAPATDSDSISSNKESRNMRDPPSPSTTILLKEKWNQILPPEWKSGNSEIGAHSESNNPKVSTGLTLQSNNIHLIHQEQVQDNHARHAQEKSHVPVSHCQEKLKKAYALEDYARCAQKHEVAAQCEESEADRLSIASRDAMPPPPIPKQARPALEFTHHPPRDRTRRRPNFASDSSPPIGCARHDTDFPIYEHKRDTKTPIPSKSGMGTDITLPPLYSDSQAWALPETVNLNHDMDKITFSTDSKSPICSPQDEGRSSGKSHPPGFQTESMTDFIARIESEVCNQEDYSIESDVKPTMSSSESMKDAAQSAFGDQHGLKPIPDPLHAHQDGYQLMPTALELNAGAFSELSTPRCGSHGSIRGGMDISAEESLEMTSFWRPNKFAL